MSYAKEVAAEAWWQQNVETPNDLTCCAVHVYEHDKVSASTVP